MTQEISSADHFELPNQRSSKIDEEEFLSQLQETERISSNESQPGKISSYETTVSTSKGTECLQDITWKTEMMSLKKPTSLASTPLTGAVGVPKPLQTLFSTKKEDWTQSLYRALEPKTPTQATGSDEGFSKKPKNKIVINKETLSGGCITSALNTPVMSNTPELNTPEIMSPIQTMLFPENQVGVEQITELTVPVVQYPVEDSTPISVPVENFIFNMPETMINETWGELNNTNQNSFAIDSYQCIDPRMAEGIEYTVDEAMEQILFNNMPEDTVDNTLDYVEPFSPVGNFDAASLNTSTAPQGDLLDWLFNKTVVAEDAEVEPHYSPMDLETEDEEELIPSFLIQTKASVKEIPPTVTSQFEDPTPSTSSAFNSTPVEIKVEVIQKKPRGRPPREGPRQITPKPAPAVKDRRTDTDHVYMGVVHDNKDDQRYRRMRDLNNDASKRCRQNRKTKFAVLEMEKDQLLVKNSELKFKVKKMEEIVAALKKKFISDIANPVKTEAAPPAEVPSFVVPQQDESFNFNFDTQESAAASAEAPIFMTQQQGATNYPDLLDFEWTGIE